MIRARDAVVDSPTPRQATIDRMGRRGEGVAYVAGTRTYVPYALPGDIVMVDGDGERARLATIVAASPERIAPVCPHFTTCGGCAVQAWAPAPYAAWKRALVVEALRRADVGADVEALVDAHGAGRRRVTFHARVDRGRPTVGFMRARAHDIVAIETCPVLDPRLAGALPAAQAIARALSGTGKPLDIVVLATESGLDIDLRGLGPTPAHLQKPLVKVALDHDLARLSNHGVIVAETRRPTLTMGAARLAPPPGAFVQATEAGESALADRVGDALRGASRIADLFAGIGTFALRLSAMADVAAFDSEAAALAALDLAARGASSLRSVRVERRDLFQRPLDKAELARFDAVVLDPPRAGAEAQMRAIAGSAIERVVSVSCDAQSFARDAAILMAGGFKPGLVTPIDQFRYSPHIEIVATFQRKATRRKRSLLG